MNRQIYVKSEFLATQWMVLVYGWFTSTGDERTAWDAGNEVIKLAEQIKAERAIAGMQRD
jgi:hypothetical protein